MRRLGALTLALCLSVQSFAQDRARVELKLNKTLENFFSKLKTEGEYQYWEGEQELHPLWDLLFYITLLKTGEAATPGVKDDMLARVMRWQLPNGTWAVTPKGNTDFDVTATLLLSLKHIGIDDSNTPNLTLSWAWLKAQNSGRKDARKINIFYRIFLTMMGVLPRNSLPAFSAKFLGLHQGAPMSVSDLGVFRTLFIPLVVWSFYVDPHKVLLPLDQKRLDSAGAALSSMPLDSKLFNFLNAGPSAVLRRFGGDWNLLSQFVAAIPFHLGGQSITEDFWAQEAIGYTFARQQTSGAWYTLGNSLVNMLALHAAATANIDHAGLLNTRIHKAAQALLQWRKLGSDAGHPFVPAAQSSIWDSSLALQNISLVDATTLKPHQQQIQNTLKWLVDSRSEVAGDWATRYPLKAGTFASWGFYPEATFYPDTDCTASVLEVLTDFKADDPALEAKRVSLIKKGFTWLLSFQSDKNPLENIFQADWIKQNNGGFPAWEKNNSKLSYDVMQGLLPDLPRVSDFSQADVSARILRLLSKVRGMPEYKDLVPAKTITQVCEFLKRAPQPDGQKNIGWEGDWISDYTYGTAEVVAGLLSANAQDSSCLSLAEAAKYMQWFKNIQNTDGGWGESNSSYSNLTYAPAPSTVMQTNFVLKALLRYEALYRKTTGRDSPYRETLVDGINWLISQIGTKNGSELIEDGNIAEKSFTAVYVKGYLYSSYTKMAQYLAIGVLGEYLKLPN